MPRDRGSGSFDTELMAFRLAGEQPIERDLLRARSKPFRQERKCKRDGEGAGQWADRAWQMWRLEEAPRGVSEPVH